MKCNTCANEAAPPQTFFCYWCGQTVCSDCVIRIQLPLDTVATVCPVCQHKPVRNEAADEAMMELMVNAALAGHDLAEWILVENGNGWQAQCRLCKGTAWVGASGVQYSLLSDRCT
jgi:hypothetical protein